MGHTQHRTHACGCGVSPRQQRSRALMQAPSRCPSWASVKVRSRTPQQQWPPPPHLAARPPGTVSRPPPPSANCPLEPCRCCSLCSAPALTVLPLSRKERPPAKPLKTCLSTFPSQYLHIYEDEFMSIGIFCFPQGASIPLHDHPGMTVFSRWGSGVEGSGFSAGGGADQG